MSQTPPTPPTITASSPIADVLLALNEIRGPLVTTTWTSVTIPSTTKSWTGKIGLFGDDLTSFNKNCAIVGKATCDPVAYSAFSGWAIGLEISVTSTGLATGE